MKHNFKKVYRANRFILDCVGWKIEKENTLEISLNEVDYNNASFWAHQFI